MNENADIYDEEQEIISSLPEYNFQEGLQKTISIIDEKFQHQDIVVVGVNGSGINVGKTRISAELKIHCSYQNTNYITIADTDHLQTGLEMWRIEAEKNPGRKTLLIIGAEEIGSIPHSKTDIMKDYKNKDLQRRCLEECEINDFSIPLQIQQIDIWVAIQSIARPFIKKVNNQTVIPFGDLLITNQYAKEKR